MNVDRDRIVHADLDLAHVAHLGVVGDRGDRAALRVEHADGHVRAVRQRL
jgi:hypothetical protein